MAITIDGPNQIIQLDGATEVSVRAIYSAWVDWTALSDNGKFLEAFTTIADPPTVPVYATLVNGWRVRPLGGDYTLTLNDGFLYVFGGGDPFVAVASGDEPRIRYENPVLAVGFATGSGLDAAQQAQLLDLWKRLGLDPANPMITTPDRITAGADVDIALTGDGVSSSTSTRQP